MGNVDVSRVDQRDTEIVGTISANRINKLRKSSLRIDGNLNANYCENHVVASEREILCNTLIISEGSTRHCVTVANGNVAPTETVTVQVTHGI